MDLQAAAEDKAAALQLARRDSHSALHAPRLVEQSDPAAHSQMRAAEQGAVLGSAAAAGAIQAHDAAEKVRSSPCAYCFMQLVKKQQNSTHVDACLSPKCMQASQDHGPLAAHPGQDFSKGTARVENAQHLQLFDPK